MKTTNRWIVATMAVLVNLSIWAVYAYSVWKKPLAEMMDWSDVSVSTIFGIAILFLWLSAAFAGKLVDRFGFKKIGFASAIFYGLWLIWSGLSVMYKSLIGMYAFYGVIGGIWLGLWYVSYMKPMLTWFPDRKWLASGLAIMWFGLSALIFWPIMTWMMQTRSLSIMFFVLWVLFLIVIAISFVFINPAPEWYLPAWRDPNLNNKKTNLTNLEVSPAMAVKTSRFRLVRVMFFINILGWISIIWNASPMAQQMMGMTAGAGALMVWLMWAFNGWGRFGRATLSDYIGRTTVYVIFFAIQILLFFLLPNIGNAILFQIVIFVIMTCYGWGFACMPSLVTELFGSKYLSQIRWYILVAWWIAGLFWPILWAQIKQATWNYTYMLYTYGFMFVLALILSLILQKQNKKSS